MFVGIKNHIPLLLKYTHENKNLSKVLVKSRT